MCLQYKVIHWLIPSSAIRFPLWYLLLKTPLIFIWKPSQNQLIQPLGILLKNTYFSAQLSERVKPADSIGPCRAGREGQFFIQFNMQWKKGKAKHDHRKMISRDMQKWNRLLKAGTVDICSSSNMTFLSYRTVYGSN